MGVPNLVVVLLCVLGAGAVVVVGAAFGKQFVSFPVRRNKSSGPDGPGLSSSGTFNVYGAPDEMVTERDWAQRSPQQDQYLRKVREMNIRQLYGNVKAERKVERMERDREMTPGASRGFDGFSQQGIASRSDLSPVTPGTPGYGGYHQYEDGYGGSRAGPSVHAQATHGGVVPGYGGHGDVRYQEDV